MKRALTMALVVAMAGGSLAAQAYEKGDFVLRLGAVNVDPDSDSSNINLPGVPTLHTEVDDDTQFGIIPMYMVTEHVGIELLAATPFKHDISLHGKGVNVDAGSTKHLPPTITAQWYPRGGKSGWQPFLGVGVNYTYFFDEDPSKDLEATLNQVLGATDVDLELDSSFGLSAQAGVDIPFAKNWALTLEVWYIQIQSNATVSTDVGDVDFQADIDPFVYHVGIAHRF